MFKKIIISIVLALSASIGMVSAQTADTQSRYIGFCSSVNSPIVRGDSGSRVSDLQLLIKQQYFFGQGIGGFYGAQTQRNVSAMQRQLGINPSGAIGPVTLARLKSIWCNGNNNPNPPFNTNAPVISINPVASQGNNVTIGWSTTGANSCSINGENVGVSGSRVYTIFNETSYRIVCTGQNGAISEKTLQVRPSGNVNTNLPVISLSVNPTTFTIGQYANLFWTSVNANTCTLNGENVILNSNRSIYISNNSQVYNLVCTGNGGTATQSITVGTGTVINPNTNAGSVTTSGTYQTGGQLSINWQIPSAYSNDAQGVILDLIDVSTNNVVGTINRYNSTQSSVNFRTGSINFTIPKSLQDTRNDAITCQTINGENLCGNLIKSGNYKIRATYFTPSNACLGYCQFVAGQRTLGSAESNSFYINSTVVSNPNPIDTSVNLSLNTSITSGNNFARNSLITITATLRNNGNTTLNFPSGSSSCPNDITLTINGNTFNSFISNALGFCTADFRTETLAPGQSIVRTFSGNINGSESLGVKNVIAKFRAQINNSNTFTEIVNNTSFNVNN
jgi:Putative peptidoglycan binding domain